MILTSIEQLRTHQKSRPCAEISDDRLKRKALDLNAISILLSPEKGISSSSLRQVDSGFNEILARIAHKQAIAVGINLSELKTLSFSEKTERLIRIRQNILICRKCNVRLAINGPLVEGKQFLLSLGASSQQASQAQCF